MLQNFRENLKGITAALLVGIIIIPFALFGIDSLFLQGSNVEEAAEVNGEAISEFRLTQAIESRKQQILNQYPDIDPAMIENDQLRDVVLDGLITQQALVQAAKDGHMAVADDTFNNLMLSAQAFQRDGKFDKSLYEFVIGQMGYTSRTYRERVNQDLLVNQFVAGAVNTAFLSDVEVQNIVKTTLQERDFQTLTLPVANYMDSVTVSGDEVQAFYDENPDQFQEDESVVVEYISLDADSLKDKVVIDDQSVRDYFEQKNSQREASASWTIAHILINDNGNAKTTLADIQQKLADGEDFATLAATYSQDFGSAEVGGSLGTFTLGSFPADFEATVTALSPGEVSQPVKSDAGYHLIKLVDKSAAEPLDFEKSYDSLKQELALQMAVEELPATVEELKEKSYNVDSLQAAADAMGLQVQLSEPFTRKGGNGIAANPTVVNTAFSEDVLKNGYASDVLELGENQYLVVKLKEHTPAHRLSLEVVTEQITALLKKQKAAALAANAADELLQQVVEGAALEDMSKNQDLKLERAEAVTRFDGRYSPVLLDAVFSFSAASLPVVKTLTLPTGDVVIYRVSAISEGVLETLPEAQRRTFVATLKQATSSREWQAYEQSLMAEAEVVR